MGVRGERLFILLKSRAKYKGVNDEACRGLRIERASLIFYQSYYYETLISEHGVGHNSMVEGEGW